MSDIRYVCGTREGERDRKWFFDWYNQWPGLLPGHHWHDFSLIRIEGEWSPSTQRAELVFRLLGVGFTITYVYGHEFNDEMTRRMRELYEDIESKDGRI